MMLVLGRGLMFARQILVAPVMIGFWGLSGYGEWMILSAVPSFVSLSNMGVGTASGLDIIGYIAKKCRSGALKEFRRSVIFIGGMALLVSLLTFLLAERFMADNKFSQIKNPELVIVCLVASAMLYQFQALFQGVWNGVGKSATGFAIANFYQLGIVLLSLGVPSINGTAELLSETILLWTVVWLVVVGGLVLQNLSALPDEEGEAASKNRATLDLIRIGIGHQLSALWQAIYYQGPLLVLSTLATSHAVGVWSAFRVISRAGNQVIDVIGQAGMPDIARYLSVGNKLGAQSIVKKQLAIAGLMALCIGLGFSIVGSWVINTWTGKSLDIRLLAYVVMGVSYLPYAAWMLLANVMYASNQPWRINIMATVVATLSVMLAYQLAQSQDVIVALTVSNLFFDFLMMIGVVKLLKSAKTITA